MKLKTIIYTTQPEWIEKHFHTIYKKLNQAKNVEIEPFVVEKFVPDAKVPTYTKPDGTVKMDWGYFQETFSNKAFSRGFNVVVVHVGRKTHRQWGIKGILGVYRSDPDAKMEFYMVADKDRRSGRGRTRYLWEFERVFLHEISHGFERWIYGTSLYKFYKRPDGKGYYNLTHYYDYVVQKIDTIFTRYDMANYRGDYGRVYKQTALIVALTSLLKLLTERSKRMKYPINKVYWQKVTQPFGWENNEYRSGIHNGSDHGCPEGTPVIAWARNFEVTHSFRNHKDMGNAAYVTFTDYTGKRYWGRCLHLQYAPSVGKYKKGDTFARTGNTGKSTGPHLHIEIWKVPIDTTLLLSERKVRENLVDPVRFFEWHVNRINKK